MPPVFLNGRFVERAEASISAFDAGLQHGVGLFETMVSREDGSVPGLRAHVERLVVSARALGLSESLRSSALAEAVRRTLERARDDEPGTPRWRLRLTITGGDLNLLEREGRREQTPTVLIAATAAPPYPPEMYARGVGVAIADLKANPLDPSAGHKTLNYWPRLRELQAAAAKRAGEALIFQVGNHLAGGCVSNAFLVRGGRLLTPIARGEEQEVADSAGPALRGAAVMPSPVLPGITRAWVLEWASARGLDVERRMLTITDVLEADECFLTNSSWGVLPVAAVESRPIGDGKVGGVTREAMEAWERHA